MFADPLHEIHEKNQAEFQAYGDGEIVATFGQPQAEYAAIRKGAALMDQPHRGVIMLTGKDRLPFLNNLLSNQTFDKQTKAGMAAGSGVHAFLLNAKSGRIITDVNVLERGDATLLELEARLVQSVIDALEKYHFAEQVKISPADYHQISLHGPKAAELLGELSQQPLPELELLASATITLYGTLTIVWRDDPTGVPGYHLLVPTDAVQSVWAKLVALDEANLEQSNSLEMQNPSDSPGRKAGDRSADDAFRSPIPGLPARAIKDLDPTGAVSGEVKTSKRHLRPIGWAAFNAARIEAGRPLFGIDFDDTVLPAETGQMARAVSFTKGCYPGQEIVARMHARNAIARQLTGLKFADDALPIAGAPVMDDQSNTIGGITSSTISPMLSNTAIAIALLKKPFFNPGTVLNVPAEGALRRAVVTELPFLKGNAT
jgi:folate-binding protein YgfZ